MKGRVKYLLIAVVAILMLSRGPLNVLSQDVQGTKTIYVNSGSLVDHECNSSEWHFIINQIADKTLAPASIHVTWANGSQADVPRGNPFQSNVAHYTTTLNLDSVVTNATAEIYSEWDGRFNLSHGPCCCPATPTPTGTSVPTETPTSTPTGTYTPPPPTNTPTNTYTPIPTDTPTPTGTSVPTETPTSTPTGTYTPPPTNTPTGTHMPTNTPSEFPTATPEEPLPGGNAPTTIKNNQVFSWSVAILAATILVAGIVVKTKKM